MRLQQSLESANGHAQHLNEVDTQKTTIAICRHSGTLADTLCDDSSSDSQTAVLMMCSFDAALSIHDDDCTC